MRLFFSVEEMCRDMREELRVSTSPGEVHNYVAKIDTMSPTAYTYETDLFPIGALEAYSGHNLGLSEGDALLDTYVALGRVGWMTPERGGPQGDYRCGMQAKIERVVLALRSKPKSKRAVLTVPFTDKCSLCVRTTDDAEWKCLRELYFRIDDQNRLHCTGVMRAQALSIISKNLHMIGRIMEQVAVETGSLLGSYTHHCVVLVGDRK